MENIHQNTVVIAFSINYTISFFRYGLYLKLFMVMGVNWTVELISFAIGGSNWYWIVTDISNIGLGVLVFFIFVWKKKVRNLVRKRYDKHFCYFSSPYTYKLRKSLMKDSDFTVTYLMKTPLHQDPVHFHNKNCNFYDSNLWIGPLKFMTCYKSRNKSLNWKDKNAQPLPCDQM